MSAREVALFNELDWRNVDARGRVADLLEDELENRGLLPILPEDTLQPTARSTNPYSPGSQNVLK
jgi:hypothetical protein